MQAKPAFGRAIVKRIGPGRTAAGLHIPETASGAEFKWVLIATSEGHTVDGHFVKAEGKPGDYAILGGRTGTVKTPDGEKRVTVYDTKESSLLPPDHFVIKLHEIEAYVPESAAVASVSSDEGSEELPRFAKGGVH